MLTVVDDAQTALLLEAGTWKPGNVGPDNDFDDTTFHQFLAGAVGARRGLSDAADGSSVGDAFLRSVRGASEHEGGNTQFGALLLLVPLVRAESDGDIRRVNEVVEATTPEDAVLFYEAFDHTNVCVGEADEYDVEDPKSRERVANDGVSLYDVMERSAERDGVAREWTDGFERCFEAGELVREIDGTTREGVRKAYLRLLAEEPDTLVAEKHGEETAESVSRRAREVVKGEKTADKFDAELRERSINPGTTADITAAGIFVALRGGWRV